MITSPREQAFSSEASKLGDERPRDRRRRVLGCIWLDSTVVPQLLNLAIMNLSADHVSGSPCPIQYNNSSSSSITRSSREFLRYPSRRCIYDRWQYMYDSSHQEPSLSAPHRGAVRLLLSHHQRLCNSLKKAIYTISQHVYPSTHAWL